LIDGKFVSCYLVIFGGGMSKKREDTGRKSFLPVGYFFVPVAHFFKRSEICSMSVRTILTFNSLQPKKHVFATQLSTTKIA